MVLSDKSPFLRTFIHPTVVCPSVRPSVRSIVRFVPFFTKSVVRPTLSRSVVRSFLRSFVRFFVYPSDRCFSLLSFVRPSLRSSVRPSVRLSTRLSVRPSARLAVDAHTPVPLCVRLRDGEVSHTCVTVCPIVFARIERFATPALGDSVNTISLCRS